MCGRFDQINDEAMTHLLTSLQVEGSFPPSSAYNIGPTEQVSIVLDEGEGSHMAPAIWWFLLENTEQGLRPNQKFATFNARAQRLRESKLYKSAFKTQRCIIPANAYYEWQPTGDGKQPWRIAPVNGAIAFAGLYRTWKLEDSTMYSCALVTTDSHPRLAHIHDKSLPVMLDEQAMGQWIDPTLTDTEKLDRVFLPVLRQDLTATPVSASINRSSYKDPEQCTTAVGEVQLLASN